MEVSVHDASDQLRKQVNDLQNQVLALKQPSAAAGRVARTISNGATPEMVKTVLWVDNEPRRNAHEIAKLEEDGYLVIQARSMSEGRSILRSGTEPDAIITDMGRKEDGKYIADAGLELIRAVREERIEALIFVYTNLRHVRRICTDVLEAGGNGTIASPSISSRLSKTEPDRTIRSGSSNLISDLRPIKPRNAGDARMSSQRKERRFLENYDLNPDNEPRCRQRIIRPLGGVAERTNALVLKTRGGKTPVGSNPTAPVLACPNILWIGLSEA